MSKQKKSSEPIFTLKFDAAQEDKLIPPELRPKIAEQQIIGLFLVMKYSAIGTLIFSALTFAALYKSVNLTVLLIWAIVVNIFAVCRYILARTFEWQRQHKTVNIQRWIKYAFIIILIQGLAWASLPLAISTHVPPGSAAFVVYLLCSLSFGGFTTLGFYLPIYAASAIPIFLATAYWFFYLAPTDFIPIAALIAMASFSMINSARNTQTIWRKTIRLVFEQEALAVKLGEEEEKYRLLIENAGDAIFIGQEGLITYANPRALELFGYTKEELAQKPIASYLIAEDREMKSNETGKKRAPGAKSFKLINKNFEELSLEVHIVDALWEGKKASLYFGRDVTNQKKMETQLYQAQKMEAVGTLAGGLAHDFNNLLMGIKGNISLMLLQIPPSDPHYERLKSIEHYVSGGAEITGQLLGFALGGKYELKVVNLNNLMEKSAAMFGHTKKEISIHMNFQEDLWSVEVDRGQIEQVLLNLYVNAGQAMPGGGHLYLSTINMDIDSSMAEARRIQPGAYIRASITDDGFGMDEDTQRRLFEPFFTTKGLGRGTGLGLASAYGILKNHGGVITVYSAKGKGTTFNIYLPASRKEVKTDEVPSGDSLFVGKGTILFVDDEEMIASVGKDMLENIGYKVITANNGKVALQIYEKNKVDIDLVILDLIMPELGGEATFEKLKAINPAVKVLLSSGYSINGQATKLLQQGCRGFIQKPYSIKELSAKIRETLEIK